ncbi:barstar family protein [Sphaerisporangium dianthi]|uniref:Barstar family protein n=1 Tax=Sphaerisporangium dianthi TaxID=1436120 RepID=A0ABV9CD65_9ACTN
MTPAARPLPRWLTVSTGSAPAVVDGRACPTRAAFFQEVARALGLPAYFGHNWDAFADSLRDATSTGTLVLTVEHAEDLLGAEPPGQLTTLLAVLAEADEAAEAGLAVIMRTDPAHEAALRERLAAALP